jgi:hypothetical protein
MEGPKEDPEQEGQKTLSKAVISTEQAIGMQKATMGIHCYQI